MKGIAEKRRYKRYKIKGDAYAAIFTNPPKMGRIINISKGGFAFRYVADEKQIIGSFKTEIFISGNGFYLKDIPFQTISDFHIDNQVSCSTVIIKQCGGQFVELIQSHISQLDHFIRNYTIGEA